MQQANREIERAAWETPKPILTECLRSFLNKSSGSIALHCLVSTSLYLFERKIIAPDCNGILFLLLTFFGTEFENKLLLWQIKKLWLSALHRFEAIWSATVHHKLSLHFICIHVH